MGSSESGGVKENGSGSIVWVRRRNGSWWPGKILGPNELSASHLMSPRSGTPVKLLGREDASVDWYNLEKSKRVKSFRCGEFDDCIERAEASAGLPTKKREKYARREDAILHALELEKQFLERRYGKLGSANSMQENLPDPEKKDVVKSSGVLENGNGKLENHNSCQLDREVDTSNFVERKSAPLNMPKASDGTHPILEEHGTDLSCHIKDLPNFVPKAVSTNKNLYTAAGFEDSNRIAVDGRANAVSIANPCFEDFSDSDSRNSLGKRKRSMEGFVEESFPKRRDKFYPSVNFRQNNAELRDGSLHLAMHRKGLPIDAIHRSMHLPPDSEIFVTKQSAQMEMPVSGLEMSTPRSQRGTFAEESTSGSSEETESDSSETHSLETRVEAGAMLSDAETCIRTQPRMLDRLQMQRLHESSSGDESDEPSLDHRSRLYFHDTSPAAGVSKWQLKGKRNVRNINKRPTDRFTEGTYLETKGRSISQRASSHSLSYCHDNGYTNEVEYMEDEFDPHSQRFSTSYLPSQVAARRQNFTSQNVIDWEELTWGRPLRGYWEERGGVFNPMFGGRNGHDLLIDVDLEVQANRQGGEHVPWVSLMSRLNGKAIIGHPIQIETLDDGSTEILVLTNDACDNVKYDTDKNKVPPVWRTAKRTANFRVPRPPSSSSQLDGDEDADNQYIHQYGKMRSKKSNSVRKGMSMKKAHSQHGAKKPSRKVNQSSNQKTKTLSSIGVDQKIPMKMKEDTSSYSEGVMKSVDSGTPTVACIPLKLVFSRLLGAVGRPPSASASAKNGVSVNSNKERNPA
ncbi:hypothetical protein RDABS01_012984 [Bienertia sinuspersici]